jgi:hypothetical protein
LTNPVLWFILRYKMRKQREMNMIEVGTEVVGIWGAMYPISDGVVVAVTESRYTVEWEDYLEEYTLPCSYPIGKIKREGETSINGSPIGVFVKAKKGLDK